MVLIHCFISILILKSLSMLVCSLLNTSHELLLACISDRIFYSEKLEKFNFTYKIKSTETLIYTVTGGKWVPLLDFTQSFMPKFVYSVI